MIYLKLFYEFLKTGLFAIGGGMATFPFLQNIGNKTGWFNESQLIDMIAVSESTPGPIGVNSATFAGFQTSGLLGGIVATFGLILPSLIIILIISSFLNKYNNSPLVKKVFYGIRPASTAMIAAAGFSVVLATFFNMKTIIESPLTSISWFGIVFALVLYYAINKYKKHPITYILISAVVGIIAGYLNIL